MNIPDKNGTYRLNGWIHREHLTEPARYVRTDYPHPAVSVREGGTFPGIQYQFYLFGIWLVTEDYLYDDECEADDCEVVYDEDQRMAIYCVYNNWNAPWEKIILDSSGERRSRRQLAEELLAIVLRSDIPVGTRISRLEILRGVFARYFNDEKMAAQIYNKILQIQKAIKAARIITS